MRRVTGIGGIFFKAQDPKALAEWYRKHLGFDILDWGGALFRWNRTGDESGCTVWCPFPLDTTYFHPSQGDWMVNFCVEDLDALLVTLRAEGVHVVERREQSEQGKFGYIQDPEGTLIELWEPTRPESITE